MNYKQIHDRIIYNAKNRILDGYFEKHHIIPRCLGGLDSSENIVKLTAREHFIIHQLLIKIYPDEPKLIYAAAMMCIGTDTHDRSKNKLYEWLKIKRSHLMSAIHKGKIITEETREKLREKNKNYKPTIEAREKQSRAQIGRRHTEESKNKISISKMGKPSPIKGRTLSDNHKQKISKANKGREISIEQREHLSKINMGKKLSSITCEKMSYARKGKTLSDTHKAKLSAAAKGKPSQYIWITNGLENRRVLKTDPIPSEWRHGRSNPRMKTNI